MAHDGRPRSPAGHGTPFNLERNPPPDFEKILDGLEKAARRYGYLATPNEARGAISASVSCDCSRGMADSISRFLENQGILLSDEGSGRFYLDSIRAEQVKSAMREGTPVLPPEDKEARLRKVRKSVMAKRRRKLRDKGPLVLLPGDRLQKSAEAKGQQGAEPAPPESSVPVPTHGGSEPNEPTGPVELGEAEESDATTTAAEVTLHEVLRQLKANYGWPEADLLPTAVMQAVSTALHPNYKNTSQAPSHWRGKRLLIARGVVRRGCMIWEVRPIHCTCRWLSSCTVKPLSVEEVATLLDLLFKEQSLEKAIEDVKAGMALTSSLNGEREEAEEEKPRGPRRRVQATDEDVKATPKPSAVERASKPKNLDEVEAQIRQLLQQRKELRKTVKEERRREEQRAVLHRSIAELNAQAEQLRAQEAEANTKAEQARQLFKLHKAEAEKRASEAEGKEREVETLREQSRELVPT